MPNINLESIPGHYIDDREGEQNVTIQAYRHPIPILNTS